MPQTTLGVDHVHAMMTIQNVYKGARVSKALKEHRTAKNKGAMADGGAGGAAAEPVTSVAIPREPDMQSPSLVPTILLGRSSSSA